jgi:cellulose synthase/poly-beta-1,6-N-acetylglucosamine synthase-like glycosyltransferase
MGQLFWGSLLFIGYTYAGYPLILWLRSLLVKRPVNKGLIEPNISIVIAVRNEVMHIRKKLDCLCAMDYPGNKYEIIIVSDGSTDGTADTIKSCPYDNVSIIEHKTQRGKAASLNEGMQRACGEIVVFADARQQVAPDAVANLAANFLDPSVGCVSGELILVHDGESQIKREMGAYWNYEKWIRMLESETGSVVGATGALYAIRRELFDPLPPETILDDVLTPLNIVLRGYRCLFDNTALANDSFSKDMGQEWRRKVRTLTGNWQLLGLRPELLLPWRNTCWWRFISHKIMRLFVPFSLIILFVSGMQLQGVVYLVATILQCFLYTLAVGCVLIPGLRRLRVASFCYFFLVMNAAALIGFWFWITGKSISVWRKPA